MATARIIFDVMTCDEFLYHDMILYDDIYGRSVSGLKT
jgi:hypothetical protein